MHLPEANACLDIVIRRIRVESAAFPEPLDRSEGEQAPEWLRSSVEEGLAASAVADLRAKGDRRRLPGAVLAAFADVGLLPTPSVPVPRRHWSGSAGRRRRSASSASRQSAFAAA